MSEILLAALLFLTPAVKAEVTAYSYGTVTASGIAPVRGRSLACPRRYPLGTMVYIVGHGLTACHDRGRLVRGNVFDLYLGDYEEAVRWGRRDLIVLVIG